MRCSSLGLSVSVLLALATSTPAFAVSQEIIEAAKKEGQVTWYTTQIVNQLVVPVQNVFEKKYGLKINYVRGNTGDVILRVLNEVKAGRVACDVFDGLSTVATLEHEKDVVLKWLPDEAKSYPPERVDPNGYWTATYIAMSVAGVNTDLVKPGEEPKNWEDLLNPKWKGKMAWSSAGSSTSGSGFVGIVLDTYGEAKGMDYLRKLAQNQVVNLPVASRQVLDNVIAGEYAIALQINNHHAAISAKQGAPVKWLPMSPTMVNSGNISVSAKAPHPNAAKLLAEFLVSPEGQTIYRDNGYVPANPKVLPLDPSLLPNGTDFKGVFYTPEKLDEKLPIWDKIFQETFK